ncbi:uncharacterized protein LOC123820657 isoform X2 [Phyllostomus hastatus]|uniref:uncharacterized protein LOC123820657 isoform X2 n=1 Tax=Phyllostomus hastatus TaxID=9423 RepID=UPI001E683473|nr:uncharacterized protein LOC123820657 isoform X2 [Phyllostomus hastatus]
MGGARTRVDFGASSGNGRDSWRILYGKGSIRTGQVPWETPEKSPMGGPFGTPLAEGLKRLQGSGDSVADTPPLGVFWYLSRSSRPRAIDFLLFGVRSQKSGVTGPVRAGQVMLQ